MATLNIEYISSLIKQETEITTLLNTHTPIQTTEVHLTKKRRGCNRQNDGPSQQLPESFRDLQNRYNNISNELERMQEYERSRYRYDVSLKFNKYFDPMHPEHMAWFRQFARQTMHKKSLNEITDEYAEPEPDYYVNNPFSIHIGPNERRNRLRTFYILCAKITMDNLNIPMALEFYTHRCPK
jgi:hypothetical protein